uniref:Uncharacterized protein n=1 Tax=Ditylenchus dipsaci TaxID=166011 RepID=A0A915EV99_9BILA
MHKSIAILVVLLGILTKSLAYEECFVYTGDVGCYDSSKTFNGSVTLYEEDCSDCYLDPNDELATITFSSGDEAFRIEGCGSDVGFWNSPEPLIVIAAGCHGNQHKKYTIRPTSPKQDLGWTLFSDQQTQAI